MARHTEEISLPLHRPPDWKLLWTVLVAAVGLLVTGAIAVHDQAQMKQELAVERARGDALQTDVVEVKTTIRLVLEAVQRVETKQDMQLRRRP